MFTVPFGKPSVPCPLHPACLILLWHKTCPSVFHSVLLAKEGRNSWRLTPFARQQEMLLPHCLGYVTHGSRIFRCSAVYQFCYLQDWKVPYQPYFLIVVQASKFPTHKLRPSNWSVRETHNFPTDTLFACSDRTFACTPDKSVTQSDVCFKPLLSCPFWTAVFHSQPLKAVRLPVCTWAQDFPLASQIAEKPCRIFSLQL